MTKCRAGFATGSEVWDTLGNSLSNRLEELQNRAARGVLGMSNDTPGFEALGMLGWESLEIRRAKAKAVYMYKVLNGLAPNSLNDIFVSKSDITDYNIAFVNSERWLAKSRVDITLCQHGKFPATLLLKFFVLYYKRNIKHFFRVDIQLYQHS